MNNVAKILKKRFKANIYYGFILFLILRTFSNIIPYYKILIINLIKQRLKGRNYVGFLVFGEP